MPLSARHVVAGTALAAVGAAMVAGLVIIGSPAGARQRRLDDRRAADLIDLSSAVSGYWAAHARLPASLDELQQSPSSAVQTRDPLTGQPYGFHVLSGGAYELCAEFQAPSDEARRGGRGRFWSHDRGPRCYRLQAGSAKKP